MQAARSRLPTWLAAQAPKVLQQPRALLLSVLLQRVAPDPAWLQTVVAGYIAACVLPAQEPADRAAAEAELTQALVAAGQQRVLSLATAAVMAESAAAATSTAAVACLAASGTGATQQAAHAVRVAALQYFTSDGTLAAAAAAQLLLQRLEQEQDSQAALLDSLLGPRPTLMELEVVCLALLLPGWEAVLQRLQTGIYDTRDEVHEMQPAVRNALVHYLCSQCKAAPSHILQLPPPLVAEACHKSFALLCSFTTLLREHVGEEEKEGVVGRVEEHMQHLLQQHHNHMWRAYVLNKLQLRPS